MVLVFFDLNATTRVPGGAKGVAEKSKFPNKYAWAESFGLLRAARSKFKVRIVLVSNKSNCASGKSGSTVASIDLK